MTEEIKKRRHPWVQHGLFTSEEKRKLREKPNEQTNNRSQEKDTNKEVRGASGA